MFSLHPHKITETGFSFVLTILMLVFNTVKDVLFGLLGGLIGIAVLQKKAKIAPPKIEKN